jgi:multidrug efflux pump subunit AcrA (membrane-fusion protein)
MSVPESDIAKIKQGATVQLSVKSQGITFPGTISEISPSSQFTGGQYGVKVAIADSKSFGIKAGMYVNVLIPGEKTKGTSSDRMTVPVAAIVNKEQLTGVYVVGNDHVALLRWIRLGKQMGDRVEVLSGLAPTDRVVVSSPERIYNGVKVNESK